MLTVGSVFERAQVHHRIRIIVVERVLAIDEIFVKSVRGIAQKARGDVGEDRVVTSQANRLDRIVDAAIVRREGVVLCAALGDDDEVVQ